MKIYQPLLTATAACLLLPAVATAGTTTVNVTGTDNIDAAGLASAANADPAGGGGGTLPLQIAVTGSSYSFQYLSGTVSASSGDSSLRNLDANGDLNATANINSYGGISGYVSGSYFALVGVFLGPGGQPVTAPSAINFSSTGIGSGFTTLAPQIGQIFMIGDGTTPSNQSRTYYVPTGAAELYLGFADSYNYGGPPGQFNDNSGSVNINVTAAPEPAPLALMLAGSGLMAAFCFRNKRRNGSNLVNGKGAL
ncbi:MAG TPA: PEP-CTERM sorting domain-containing protein [Verrucomicrobiae bacterium]|jgi:hypothetical protein|nr:PEP-CTERM sorting domain-containing protein [Verrucomicrobiae bacterium]